MENKYTPTFAVLVEIVESLAGTINEINDVYKNANKEVANVWKMKRQQPKKH